MDSKTLISKLPSTLSEEELLQKALSEDPVEQEATNNVVAFLLFYKIEPGAFPVNRKLIYKLYQQHTKESWEINHFLKEMNLYIPSNKSVYFINKNALNIGHKTFELLKKRERVQKSPTYKRHFENFCKACGIQDGGNWYSSQLLFKEYREWCETIKRQKPLNKINFNKFLKSYISKHKLINQILYVAIDRKTNEKETKK